MSLLNDLGDRIKGYEARETDRRAMPGLPLVARVDGRSFSTFTAGMRRPYDQDLSDLMLEVAKYLVEQVAGARVVFTQSDEISIILDPFGTPSAGEALSLLEGRLASLEKQDVDAEIQTPMSPLAGAMIRGWIQDIRSGMPPSDAAIDFMFSGKFQKLTSIISSLTTARFLQGAMNLWPDRCLRQLPVFDARVFEVPNRTEAVNALLWRELDATKNAVSMAARAHFSTPELHGKTSAQMQEMLFQGPGINFNDYPARFRRGVYVRRQNVLRELSEDELARIPEHRRPKGPVFRRATICLDLPPIMKIANRVEVLLDGAAPVLEASMQHSGTTR